MQPVERLINLVALLLDTRRPLTFEDIRDKLEGAYDQGDVQTAKRMFERDKDLLRDHGIPLEVVPTDAWELEEGYLIPPDKYYLPEIEFTPEEISALFVAAHTPGEDTSAEEGVRKLLYGAEGGLIAGLTGGPLAAGPDVPGSRVSAVADAISAGRRIAFEYRTARGVSSGREIDPYGLVWRSGHWYVVGRDLGHDEIRSFRLSRMASEPADTGDAGSPPQEFRAADHVRSGPWGPGEPKVTARIAFSPDVAWWATAGVPGANVAAAREDGWVEVTVPASAGDALAGWVLGFGPDGEALAPQALREEVVARLEDVLAGL